MASKRESTFLNMVLTLFLVTLVASSALAYIYQLTKDPIAKAQKEKLLKGIKKVSPEFDNQPLEEAYKVGVDEKDSLTFYPVKKDGKQVATAIKTFTYLGFSGRFSILVGITPDEKISGTYVLEHKETPGLGDKMESKKSDWSEQFKGVKLGEFKLDVEKDGGDVEAITASTVTSRAFCDAVNRAYEFYQSEQQKNTQNYYPAIDKLSYCQLVQFVFDTYKQQGGHYE